MRKLMAAFTMAFVLCILLSSCSFIDNDPEANRSNSETSQSDTQDWMHTECSKDYVTEFISILGTVKGEGLLSGFELDEEHCYNVTPSAVSESTDIKIFKFSDSCASFALIDGEVFELCTSFGGYGFFNAAPWDYDADGTMDLLIASSWGSGMHRSEISVFNVKTKQSKVICTSLEHENTNSENDWFVTTQSPSAYTGNSEELSILYVVYSAEVQSGDSLVDLSYVAKTCVGSIELENGTPVFHPLQSE
ncbi:MAG: hypothetical protein IJ072_06285 [Oscillospiraceae bacterium]|nr:hypothetical protein [Oscillospiraceae bacterium]